MKKGRQLYCIFKMLKEKKNYQIRILYPKQTSDMKENKDMFKHTHKLETLSTVSSQ